MCRRHSRFSHFGMKRRNSDNEERPRKKKARPKSPEDESDTKHSVSVTAVSGGIVGTAYAIGVVEIVNVKGAVGIKEKIAETTAHINLMDASKHVSTHTEHAAYRLLKDQGCVVIRGRSGSGKSHMGYTLLRRASKEFSRKPVKLSSPADWDSLLKSSNDSNATSIVDKYVVLIDDIFGSTNLIQNYLDLWCQKFDLVSPQVESGHIWLVITSRPEIIGQKDARLRKYDIFKSSRRIILDEKEHCLTEDEKNDFLNKLCGNLVSKHQKRWIAQRDTPLGFPQCCYYFASQKHAQERGLTFFWEPFECIENDIECVKQEHADWYCALLMVLAYDGCLPNTLLETTPDEFKNRYEEMKKVCCLDTKPDLKKILQNLCGAFLVSDGGNYKFSHRSIHDVLAVDLCKSYPELGIAMSSPSMLVEYIQTTGLHSDMPNVIVLEEEYYPKLIIKLQEYLLNKDTRSIVLSHPSLNNEKIFKELFRGWDIRWMLERGKEDWCQDKLMEVGGHWCSEEWDLPNREDIGDLGGGWIDYSYFLSHTIMTGMAKFAEYIIDRVGTATDVETQPMLDEALDCALYKGQNRVVDKLLSKGTQPSLGSIYRLSASPEINFEISSKLVNMVKPKSDDLKLIFINSLMYCNETFLKSIIEMCTENMDNPENVYSEGISCLINELNGYATLDHNTFSRTVNLMSILYSEGGIIYLDKILTLAAQKNAPDTLIQLVHTSFHVPPSNQDDMGHSKFHSKKFHQLLGVLFEGVAPVQLSETTVRTLLHEAAGYQCMQCVSMLHSRVKGTDSAGNTALHCMVQSDENHNHEVLDFLMRNTNYMCVKNKSDELPLHLASNRHCSECISRLLNPKQCTCDETVLYQRDESCEPSGVKGTDVNMEIDEGHTIRAQCTKCEDPVLPVFDINYQDWRGNTALHYIHHNSHLQTKNECFCLETCQLFLAKRADAHIKNKERKTVLHLAAEANCKTCVEILLPMSDINAQDKKGNTALHYLQQTTHLQTMNECICHETCQHFLNKNANMHIKNMEGLTVLHLAAKANCKTCVEMLLPMSDINAQDEKGNTALHYLQQTTHLQTMNERICHETCQHFLDNGADLHIKNKKGQAILHLVTELNCNKCLEMLLPRSGINNQDEEGNTALHYLQHNSHLQAENACFCYETCQLLLDKRAYMHIRNKKRQTVLHLAAKAHCKPCVEMLLPMSDINDQDEEGNTALHYLTHRESGCRGRTNYLECYETCQLILDMRADMHIRNTKGLTVLHLAAKANCKPCMEMLLPMSDINDQDEEGNTALHYLQHNSHVQAKGECFCYETCQLLLDMGADMHTRNKKGLTVLHLAAKANCKPCVEMLLPMYDTNDQDEEGNTALHFLHYNSHFRAKNECFCHESCQLFLDKWADVHIKNKKGQLALHLAAKAYCKPCTEILLPMYDIHVDAKDEEGNTALHYLMHHVRRDLYGKSNCFYNEACQLFLNKGADVHIKNKNGRTVLHLAAEAHCETCVKMLLPMSDINHQDKEGNTALHYLVPSCHETCQLFLDNMADVNIRNKKGQTVMHLAAKEHSIKGLEMLLPVTNINEQDEDGNTALHHLVQFESHMDGYYRCLNTESYQLFLHNRADVHIKNKKGETVLHLVAMEQCKRCVAMMLPASDVNYQDKKGNTALHYLIHHRNDEVWTERSKCLNHKIRQLCIDKGADVHIKNKWGQTVLDQAFWESCYECQEMLLAMCNIHYQDEKGNTLLHRLIHERPGSYGRSNCSICYATCQLFLDRGAHMPTRNKKGQTALHLAAKAHCKPCVEMLLPMFDINDQDKQGNTALHYLARSGNLVECLNIYQLFRRKGADEHIRNKKGQTALHLAAKAHCKPCVEMLLPMCDLKDQDEEGNTAIHYITHPHSNRYDKSHCFSYEACQLFLDKGVDKHMKNKKGQTVLHLAVESHIKCVEMLLPMHEINDQDEEGNTALHYLKHRTGDLSKCLYIHQLFLRNGADAHIRNKKGQTILHLAAKAHCKPCVEMLLPMSDINDQDEEGNTAPHYLQHNSHVQAKDECFCHETCKLLLDKGADVHMKNKKGQTIMHFAAKAHCKPCVKMLLTMPHMNYQDEEGNTALHYLPHKQPDWNGRSKYTECHETCQFFLDKVTDVHIKNKKGETVLHLAAKANCNECMEILLPKFDVNDQDEEGNTALHYITDNERHQCGRSECLDICPLFLAKGADVHTRNKKGQTVLHLAAKAHCKPCVKMLLPMSDMNYQDEEGSTALHYLPHNMPYWSRRSNSVQCFETCQLFRDKGADMQIRNKKGQTVLHLAAKAHCKPCVKMLLPMSDMNYQDEEGSTALHYLPHKQSDKNGTSIYLECHETCQLFLDKVTDVHIKNKKGETVLHLAAKANCNECMEILLPNFDVNDQDESGNTALHYITDNERHQCGRSECLDICPLFLAKGADVHTRNKIGQTVLHLAAKAHCKPCVEMLLPLPDMNYQDEEGNTALHYLPHKQPDWNGRSKYTECHETCQLLLDKVTDVHIKNKKGETVLHLAAKASCNECMEILLPMFDVNDQDEEGNTALHYVADNKPHQCGRSECLDIYQLFLAKGANVHTRNKKGQTVLHLAAKTNKNKCVEMLLPMFDINDQDEEGNTALHYLANYQSEVDESDVESDVESDLEAEIEADFENVLYQRKKRLCEETFQLLREKGANVHIKNKKGQTVLQTRKL